MNLFHKFALRGKTLLDVCTGRRATRRRQVGSVLNVYSKGGGLGDELMTVCAIQAAVRSEPALKIVMHARHYSLLHDAPGIADVRKFHGGSNGIGIAYAQKHPLPILKQMVAQLGAPDAEDFSLELPKRPLQLPAGWPCDDHPKIVVQISASGWTPNKQWPLEHWRTLIESLPPRCSVIEVGTGPATTMSPRHPNWYSLAGKTSQEEYVSCMKAASVFIGPISSGMHLAHAFHIPSVIIAGGWEAADFPYSRAVQFGSNLECAPCWLRTPCPINLLCLREISPAVVLQALDRMIR